MISSLEAVTAASSAAPSYQLNISLVGSAPLIWRRLSVPGNANLGWLHAVLQVAMGWTNSHLHHFLTQDARYTDLRYVEEMDIGGMPDRDETKTKLMQIAPTEGAKFGYEYDFGDSWEHEIVVEKILRPNAAAATMAICLNGARACPPEDCGGIWGYENLLKALKNRKHPEHKQWTEWTGGSFDAKYFNASDVNVWLRKLKWPRVTEAQLRKVIIERLS